MPNLDLSFTITAIIALISLISPILTSIINNHHDNEIRKIEMNNKLYENNVLYKKDILQNYLSTIGKVIIQHDSNSLIEYGYYFPRAIILIDDNETISLMKIIHEEIMERSWEKADSTLQKLLTNIRKYINNCD